MRNELLPGNLKTGTPDTLLGYIADGIPAGIVLGTNLSITAGVLNATGGSVSPLTTKGDLYVFSTANDRIGVGENDHVLTADSSAPTGLKWAAVAATTPSWTTGVQGKVAKSTQVEMDAGTEDDKGVTPLLVASRPELYSGGAFAATVDLTLTRRMFVHSVAGAIAYTKTGSLLPSHFGNVRVDFLLADGVNKPMFSSDFIVSWDNWVNTINTTNVITFRYLSSGDIDVDIRNYA